MNPQDWQITNATLATGDSVENMAGLHIVDGKIQTVLGGGEEIPELLNLNLHGLSVFPGFVNGHDSLLASYEAFRGDGAPYLNWLAYDNQLKASQLFKERMLVGVEDLYRLGAVRNLIAGVTTVVDHIPHFVRQPFQDSSLPVRLLPDYGISHSICSYSLDWGDGPRAEYEKAAAAGIPYITHIAEGFDPESKNSLRRLDKEGALGEHTVLVHGLSLSPADLDLIAERGASLVWCPVSNQSLYEATLPLAEALKREINVCLGSDAAMFGSPNLLADLKMAGEAIAEAGFGLDTALSMVTTNAARAMRLSDTGTLAAGATADFVVLKGKYPRDPHRSLVEAELSEIYLVVRDGQPLYGEELFEKIFSEMGLLFDRISVKGSRKIVTAGTKKLLESIRAAVGRSDDFYFLPQTAI
ncbi:MAG: amidohydrolase family protein [bacterium]|nr:amidohydrolase family protein [bacterium]